MHALVIPFPTLGHINPTLQFCHLLLSTTFPSSSSSSSSSTATASAEDHTKITVVLSESAVYNMRNRKAAEKERDKRLNIVSVPDGLSPEDRAGPQAEQKVFGATQRLGPAIEELLARIQEGEREREERGEGGSPISCIIADTFMASLAGTIAEKHGLPRVSIWTSNASAYAMHLFTPTLVEHGYIPVNAKGGSENRMISCIPGLPSLPISSIPSILQVPDVSHFIFQFFLKQFEVERKASWVVMNTVESLEHDLIRALGNEVNLAIVGPLLPPLVHEITNEGITEGKKLAKEEDNNDGDKSCLEWLDLQSPSSVLYISFGSVHILPDDSVRELALGLEASGLPFLWVLRTTTPKPLSELLPSNFVERTKEKGRIIKWAPQLKVLDHIAVGGFLTHCGWNSVIESLTLGVPLIGWPTFAEQNTTCWLLENVWGVGLHLKSHAKGDEGNHAFTKEEVEVVVKELMEGEKGKAIRKKAKEMKESFCLSSMEGGSSHSNLQMFVQDMRRRATLSSS